MPDQVLATHPIWVFGKKIDFKIYQVVSGGNRVPLHSVQYQANGANPATKQKNQICLHFTAGNSPASGTLEWWNTMGARPNYFCPNYDEKGADKHEWGQAAAGDCPLGHGKLRAHWGGAHYVLELKEDRADAAQPYTDVIEIMQDDAIVWHGEAVNDSSIGIEHANVGTTWGAAKHDAFTGAGGAKRPTDHNRWYHNSVSGGATSNLNAAGDYQAYQEEQYLAMILLLRHLCIKHRIPRRFLGDTIEEKMSRYWHNLPAKLSERRRSQLLRFRGILSHMNCHAEKTCPGPAMHRNRLFRGVIDEWWLPVEFDGAERPYYMGPFDPQNGQPSYFRFSGGALQQELFHDANLAALQETRSYYDLDHQELYYAQTERVVEGGTYPVGRNRIWHGGVHLEPKDGNRKIYAAASGTIVAARLGGDATTEADALYGSQRFVLIRHTLHTELENDPGGGQRTNYAVDPKYFFTLYMHLAPVANVAAVDNQNPPWFNYWLRHRAAAADANAVFSPMAEVSVGDWLGGCGQYQGRRMVHFEVVSKEELTVAPWNDADHRFYDSNADAICDINALDKFVTDAAKDGLDTIDILKGARELRKVKAYHKSEWALAGPDALTAVIPNQTFRESTWKDRLKNFMWVADAVKAYANLANELCDAAGMMWHYHPITFMEFVNRRIVAENGQVSEPDAANTNITMEDGYLTRFVSFAAGAAVAAAADNKPLRPYDIADVSNSAYEYQFTRADLACRGTGPILHVPQDDPPTATKFHVTLLDFIETVRRAFDKPLKVNLAYVCSGHNAASQTGLCSLGTTASLQSHADGNAVDISPTAPSPDKCKELWAAIHDAQATFDANCGEHGGEPSHADLPEGFSHLEASAPAAIQAKLVAKTALTAAEAAQCIFHLELVRKTKTVVWDCFVRRGTKAWQVDKVAVQGRIDLVGFYKDKADAELEKPWVTDVVIDQGSWFELSLRKSTKAIGVRVENGDVIGTYTSSVDADAEKGSGDAWPKEQ